MNNLSCIILAKNEQELIGKCIDSLKQLEPLEILVIDDGSTDETVHIASSKKARVIIHKKNNFAEARNFAKAEARGDWLFYIDADEQVSEDLITQIKKEFETEPLWNSGQIVRVNYYLGKKWPVTEKVMRLFRKSKLKEWYGELHESPNATGALHDFSGFIYHFTHRTLSEMVDNTIVWSEIEAKLRLDAKHPRVVWWRFPRVMIPVFFDYYIKQGGWKVGAVGLIESMYQAFSIFITYARLWEMQNIEK